MRGVATSFDIDFESVHKVLSARIPDEFMLITNGASTLCGWTILSNARFGGTVLVLKPYTEFYKKCINFSEV